MRSLALLGAIPTLLIIITLSFLLLHAAPGGPFDSQKQIPPAIKANIERMYHLDEPLYRQYFRYLGSIARGDFGPSYQYRDTTVNEIIREGFPIDAADRQACALIAAILHWFADRDHRRPAAQYRLGPLADGTLDDRHFHYRCS